VTAIGLLFGRAEPHRAAAESPLERAHDLAGGPAAGAGERNAALELKNRSEPSAAADCDTNCEAHCERQDCSEDPFGNEWCGPVYVSPPCKAACEAEKAAACASVVEHCTDKGTQKASVDEAHDRVVWAELGSDDYAVLAAAVASAASTAGAASPAVFEAFYEALGDLIVEVAEEVGEEVAAQYFYDAMNQGTVIVGDITIGRQVWKREECSPSCDDPSLGCVPLPASNAFYVAWDYY
jgi:hypothetical protein